MARLPRLDRFDNAELSSLWAAVMKELLERGVVRSANNTIADWAEQLVARHYKVEPEPSITKASDVRTKRGERIQVKALRLTRSSRKNLSPVRKLEEDGFDTLIAVIFERDLELKQAWRIPRAAVCDHARYSEHVNGHILRLKKDVLSDRRTKPSKLRVPG